MPTINQRALVLESQNQLRNADRLARDWAIAHAGAYQGQARRELGGSGPFREWQRDNLTIRISKLTSAAIKQGQLVSVRYEPSASAEPYVAYLMTYAPAATERSGGYLMSVTTRPDGLGNAELPWDEKAGPAGLETLTETVNADRARPSDTAGGRHAVTAIDDLFDHHDTAIALTEDGQQDRELRELADQHGDWAAVVSISASEQLAVSRELPDHQLAAWVRAKIALFSRYPDGDGARLRMVEIDGEPAAVFMDEERDRVVNGAANRNSLALMEMLESVSIVLSVSMLTDAKVMADALVESVVKPETEPAETGNSDRVAAQQRVYVLEDQLNMAKAELAELQERLAQYENYEADDELDETGEQVPGTESGRETAVLDAITNLDRFPRLRFLTNCAKALADYGKRRPNGVEIIAALDAINRLAQAWYNTPKGAIGPWDNYFNNLTGWTHANGESEFTMSRYGDKRSFSDQEHRRRVTIERHLTYRGSSGGLQIYFDRDDLTDRFIIGYIGEHLPYATNRS